MADDAEQSARRRAEQHGLRFVDLTQSALAPGAASLLPEAIARRHHAVPIGRRLGTPVIAVADPGDLFAMDALRISVGREFVAVVARPEQVERAIRQLYTPGEVEEEDVPISADAFDAADTQTGPVAAAQPDAPSSSVAVEDPPVGAGGIDGGEAPPGLTMNGDLAYPAAGSDESEGPGSPATGPEAHLPESNGQYAEFTITGDESEDNGRALDSDAARLADRAGNGHNPGSG